MCACRCCGEPLIYMPPGTDRDSMVCDNEDCELYCEDQRDDCHRDR